MKNRLCSLIILAVCAAFFGCATNTGDPKRDARGRAANQAMIESAKILGQVGANALLAAAKSDAQTGKVDVMSSAAQGMWATIDFGTLYNAAGKVVQAYSGNQLPKTASAAQSVAKAAIDNGKTPAAVSNAIATVISSVAMTTPPKS